MAQREGQRNAVRLMGEITTVRRRRHAPIRRGPTLHDVARVAGVSSASVSRALSRPELVSVAVHERVAAAILALDYVPNSAAQALSGRPSRLVGVVVSSLDDPVVALELESLARELAAGGFALILGLAGAGAGGSEQCARELIARGADAIVVGGDATPVEPGRVAPGRRVAWASFDETPFDPESVSSGFDRAKALALGARYLRQLGHIRIGVFAVGGERCVDAMRAELAGAGIDLLGDPANGESSSGVAASDALDRWQALQLPPTAVICGSDAAAAALLRECGRRSIVVPAALSVVGFGDTEMSRQTRPTLTSVRVPACEAGRALARSLVGVLAGETDMPPQLTAKLVVRDSTGALGA
jgi:LacI family transcriptional regulator